MAKITVDARGLSCPQPVVLTMEALKQNAEAYEILVDNKTALNNVSRFAKTPARLFPSPRAAKITSSR